MPQRRRWWIALALLAAACFGLWRSTADLRWRWLVGALHTEMLQAAPARRDVLATQLAACGPQGWQALVQTLAEDEPAVRNAAGRALLAEVAAWERAADETSRAQLLLFSTTLPELAQGLSERGQCGAAVVARRLLVARAELSLTDRERVLWACAEVLRLPGAALPPENFRDGGPAAVAAAAPPALEQPLLVARGGARQASAAPPALLPETAVEPLASAAAPFAEAGERAPPPVQESATSNAPATVRDPVGEEAPLREPDALDSPAEAAPLTPTPASAAEQDLAARLARMPAAWAGLLRAFARAQSDDPAVRTAALAELRRRLVTQRELTVAAQLHATAPDVRQEWVRALPGLRGIDSPFWLTWMCTDPDEDVRRTAVEVAATAADPELWQRIRGLAQGDPASAIRQLATTLQAQRTSVARDAADRLR